MLGHTQTKIWMFAIHGANDKFVLVDDAHKLLEDLDTFLTLFYYHSHEANLVQCSMEFVKDNYLRFLFYLLTYTTHLWKVFGFYNCGIECVC
jgi:hypothetical protein